MWATGTLLNLLTVLAGGLVGTLLGDRLPPRLRDEYGLRWSRLHELALPLAAGGVKLTTKPMLRAASRLAPPPKVLAASA